MFKQGLKHGAFIVVLTFIATALTSFFNNKEASEIITGAVLIFSMLFVGYIFKRQYGSIFAIIIESKNIKGIMHYILGAGLIFGPIKLISTEFPIPDINPFINLILLLISIPLSGMSLIGALIIGGIFYQEKI